MQDLPWHNIWSADKIVEVFNEHLLLLVGRCVPTKVIRVRNKDKPWFDDQCRHAFSLKQEAHRWWTRDRSRVNWEEFVICQLRANETTRRASISLVLETWLFLLMPRLIVKWWSILKSALFGFSSSLLPHVGGGGGLVCESVSKSDLLSVHFNNKQFRESVDLPLTWQPSPRLTTFAVRSSEVRRLLSNLDPYWGTDPMGMFPFFLRRTADILSHRLREVFRQLVGLSSFPACWRQANVNSYSEVLSKVFERLVSVRFWRFMERSGVLPTT